MKNKKSIFIIGLVVLVLGITGAILVKKNPGAIKEKKEPQLEEVLEADSLVIESIGAYTGPYMEDGTDEPVEDVMMIIVKNNGHNVLQYAEVTIMFGDVAAEFSLSTLRPAGEVLVLEKNRRVYSEKEEVTDVILDNVVYFTEEPSMCEDVIFVQKLEGAMNIENISGQDITGPVAVYYKTVTDGMYQGGITYRTLLEDGLKAGEIRQTMTSHFSVENSEIMFVTYVP